MPPKLRRTSTGETKIITLQGRDHWICRNASCGAEIIVATFNGITDGAEPTCFCGSGMQKSYAELRKDESVEAGAQFSGDQVSRARQELKNDKQKDKRRWQ